MRSWHYLLLVSHLFGLKEMSLRKLRTLDFYRIKPLYDNIPYLLFLLFIKEPLKNMLKFYQFVKNFKK